MVFAACGGSGEAGEAAQQSAGGEGRLTADQLEKGIGPIDEVELGPIDPVLAARGEESFRMKCFACHRLTEQYVAPKLGDVLDRHTPEYVMNMILNPAEMTEQHPAARELLAEFMTQMPNQNLSEEEARAILEYIRFEAEKAGTSGAEKSP
jgi:mono/diheme cytochrome c family protein